MATLRENIKDILRPVIGFVGPGFHPDDYIEAGGKITDEYATACNIFMDYAIGELKDEIYDVCAELFVEKGWMLS